MTPARERLVAEHMDMARAVARKMHVHGIDEYDNLESDAMWGLARAGRTWREDGGMSFRNYAWMRCAGAIRRGRQTRSGIGRDAWQAGERAPHTSDVQDEIVANALSTPGATASDLAELHDAMRSLDERSQRVVMLSHVHGLSQSEIAPLIGVSQMHVSRIDRRARAALRSVLAA